MRCDITHHRTNLEKITVEMLTIEDVMQLLNIGRPTATRILNSKKCPTLPRKKGGKYLVPKKAFLDYLDCGIK